MSDIDGPWDPLRHAWYSSRQREPLNWILPGQSLDRAIKTINQILDSPRAHWIMARIIDGAGEDDAYRWAMELSQPPKPQPGALLVYAQELKDFKAEEILVDYVILQEYQDVSKNKSLRDARLLEIVCHAIHAMAIDICRIYDPPVQKSSNLERLDPRYRRHFRRDVWPTIRHPVYPTRYNGDYPEKLGFWAETQILGGTVHFNRNLGAGSSDLVWLEAIDFSDGIPYSRGQSGLLRMVDPDDVARTLNYAVVPIDQTWTSASKITPIAGQETGVMREKYLGSFGEVGWGQGLDNVERSQFDRDEYFETQKELEISWAMEHI